MEQSEYIVLFDATALVEGEPADGGWLHLPVNVADLGIFTEIVGEFGLQEKQRVGKSGFEFLRQKGVDATHACIEIKRRVVQPLQEKARPDIRMSLKGYQSDYDRD